MTARAICGERLDDEAGEQLLQLTGGIDYGPGREPGEAARDPDLVRRPRRPAVRPEGGRALARTSHFAGAGPVMYHADAGVLDPDRAMAAMLRLADARGADVRFGTPVPPGGIPDGDSAIVHTDSGTFTAPVWRSRPAHGCPAAR